VDQSATEEAYQQNRRIEISVVPRDTSLRKVVDEYLHGGNADAPPPPQPTP